MQCNSQRSPSLPVYSTAELGGNVAPAEVAAAYARHDGEVLCEGGQEESSRCDPYQ